MDIIVDIQGMRDKDHGFLPKEVAVVATNQPLSMHWIVAPPYQYCELPPEVRRLNKYLTLHHHGLEWYEGDVGCKQLYANLREIARHSRTIWTRGYEKAELLSKVMTRDINDLEKAEWGCPGFKILPPTCTKCLRHSLDSSKPFSRCALAQANMLKNFLQTITYNADGLLCETSEEDNKKQVFGEEFCEGCAMCQK